MPQPSATVYSQRLPNGGRPTATARAAIDIVRKKRAQTADPVAKEPKERGTATRTGTVTDMALVAACRYAVHDPATTTT